MNVYLLMHDDLMYDMGDRYVRGVYLTETAATEAIVTRTAAGQRSRAYGAHTESCCSVEERAVEDTPIVDIREDDPPPDPNAPRLVPDALVDDIIAAAVRPSPFAATGRR